LQIVVDRNGGIDGSSKPRIIDEWNCLLAKLFPALVAKERHFSGLSPISAAQSRVQAFSTKEPRERMKKAESQTRAKRSTVGIHFAPVVKSGARVERMNRA
jgi:hypothetical protein